MTAPDPAVVLAHYERIDPVASVSQMFDAVEALPDEGTRRAVVLLALTCSRHQFTWSWIAERIGLPSSDWPVNPFGAG